MPFSSELSPQMKMLTEQQQSDIMNDYAQSPDASGPPPSINMLQNGMRISGPVFAGDEVASPATVGPLTRTQVLDAIATVPDVKETPAGALSQAAPAVVRNTPPDIAELLKQYMPQDDSQSRYMALAAGLLSPTKTGSFGEQLGNVASAMQAQRAEQDKMRAQYIPLIMQQVAQQQAREEQARYRLEAQQQAQQAQIAAQQAAQLARAEQAAAAQQARSEQFAAQQQALNERAAADRASRESIAAAIIGAKTAATMASQGEESPPPTPILGVPVPRVLPWQNQSNLKDRDKVRAAEIARGSKEVESDAEQAKKDAALAQSAQQFMNLNNKVSTGGILDKTSIGKFGKSFDSDYATMQAIASELTPAMRTPGSGSSSDLDVKMFERAAVGVDKPKETNANIAAALTTRAKQAKDYAEFRSTYLEQNGTLQGANRYWSEYVNKNPIFDPEAKDTFALNKDRKDWRAFFASQSGQPAPSKAVPVADPVAAARAELERRKGGK